MVSYIDVMLCSASIVQDDINNLYVDDDSPLCCLMVHLHITSTQYSIPSVQTIDELMVEKCQPGDVILFDRRCECCASGPAAAFACLLGKAILCEENDGTRSVERGSYEHCGKMNLFCSLLPL